MTGSTNRRTAIRITATLSAATLIFALAACAPEPDKIPEGKQSGPASEEPSWPESASEDTEKNATVPASFPIDFVPLPENPEVDNAGERGERSWFVVLKADSLEAASTMLDKIAADGDFAVSDDSETGDGGRSASLTIDGYLVNALTLMEGEQALLSLDVSSTQI